jgi:hypothetical protein
MLNIPTSPDEIVSPAGGPQETVQESTIFHRLPASNGAVSLTEHKVIREANGATVRLITHHKLLLACGCVATTPDMVARCSCGCGSYVCVNCRMPCGICPAKCWGPHLFPSRTTPGLMLCKPHHEQGH